MTNGNIFVKWCGSYAYSVDLSDHVTSATINRSFDELEVTAMGSQNCPLAA